MKKAHKLHKAYRQYRKMVAAYGRHHIAAIKRAQRYYNLVTGKSC